ncbi:hypothetical protein ENUP19_0099G0026 [Entamoeba nuttalli]|uniref:Transporter, major facilitator family protein n=2 Tax=Entamoeba nuttalli TaxID=412467 RepID=K2HAY3_ENTNP|nr:transporter, major facilitator family protein [Entamoeba nuttalli P19]EKE39834.1 transporter, major facilitator family protein [Entamoeba nuttalli P19]|eukprot:XP_008857835.1 transporter, major facilitator family protein [Entamoeba nuttalli P19]
MNKCLKFLLFPFSNLPRHLLVAFLYNTSCYFYWIVVPLLFNEQGASAIQLALLQTVCFLIYASLAPFGGKLADKLNPFIVLRLSMVFLTIGEVIVAIWPTSKIGFYFSAAFWAFSALTFWPAAVGTIGKEAGIGHEARDSGLFAVSWSFGKAIGYAAGGFLKSALGASTSLYIAIGINVVIMIVYPYRHVKWLREKIKKEKEEKKMLKNAVEMNKEKEANDVKVNVSPSLQQEIEESQMKKEQINQEEKDDVVIPNEVVNEANIKIKVKWNDKQLKNKTYIYLGYIMQLGLFGASCVITNQYIKIADEKSIGIPMKGSPEDNFVSFNFFIMYFAQTIMFGIMSFTDKWTYHRSLCLLAQAIFLVFSLLLVVVFNPYIIFAMSFIAGLAAGFSYQTSTYYSLRASEKSKSLFVGVSESVASMSNAILPLIAGLLSNAFGVFAPMYFIVVVMLITLTTTAIIYHIGYFINNKRQAKRADPTSLSENNEEPSPIETTKLEQVQVTEPNSEQPQQEISEKLQENTNELL